MIKRILHLVFLAFFLVQAAVGGQGAEVKRILSEIRAALGGDQSLAAVKTLSMEGQTTRTSPSGEAIAQEFEIAIDLNPRAPKYLRTDVIANMGGNIISRRQGFNGNDLIYDVDMPPALAASGAVRVTPMSGPGPNASPEELAEQAKQRLLTSKREFARLAIAVLGEATAAYPMEFKYLGAKDGKETVEVVSTDGFKAVLHVDGRTHLPAMLSWMDKEPIRLRMTSGTGGNAMSMGGGVTLVTGSSDGPPSPEEIAQRQAEMQRRMQEAEANRRVVEFRVVYGDYKTVNGVRVPTRIQHTIDGATTEQVRFTKISVNQKVDGKFRKLP